ncbi:interleukin-12 subunit beta [Aulostomus maculatus]
MLGEYSCWNGNKLLSRVQLLELQRDEDIDSQLTCWATSYNCNFSCTWNHSGTTAAHLGLGQDCREGRKSCVWLNSISLDRAFHFELMHNLSPHAEESAMIEVTFEALMNFNKILRRTMSFYLRDIVRPNSPHIVGVQDAGSYLNVSIKPPKSWSTPLSFFNLEYEIESVLRDNGKSEFSKSTVPKGIAKLRAHCRDLLVGSEWSDW